MVKLTVLYFTLNQTDFLSVSLVYKRNVYTYFRSIRNQTPIRFHIEQFHFKYIIFLAHFAQRQWRIYSHTKQLVVNLFLIIIVVILLTYASVLKLTIFSLSLRNISLALNAHQWLIFQHPHTLTLSHIHFNCIDKNKAIETNKAIVWTSQRHFKMQHVI